VLHRSIALPEKVKDDRVMAIRAKEALTRFLIFGMMGLLLEVFFTAILKATRGDWNIHGMSSPWMIFDYGLLGLVLMPVARPLIRLGLPLPARAVVYMIGIFAVEFASGWVFEKCGLKIWDYSNLPWNLWGYITALYVPLWYVLGLAAELLYRRVDAVAVVLVRGLAAGQIRGKDEG
jgi:uncharacterized membrane protein